MNISDLDTMGDPAVMTEPQKQSTTSQKKLKTDLTDYTAINDDKTGPYAENLELDALIVGAGFSMSSPLPHLPFTFPCT